MYNIKGFPTVYLTDSKGKPYAITGYIENAAPKIYLEHLAELQKGK